MNEPVAIGCLESKALADTARRLRQVGQRATPQRLAVLGVLEPGEHLSADDVFGRVAAKLPGICRSTVYRTLEAFRDAGLVSETDLGAGAREFELLDERHHHLVCQRCGVQIELDDALVAPLREAIGRRYGFAPVINHLAIFGVCASCRVSADAEAGAE